MKAALATRSTLETNTLLRNLAQQNVREARNNRQASGQSTYTSILIYNGFALDTRVVVTFLFMEGLFVYLLVGVVVTLRIATDRRRLAFELQHLSSS